MNAIQKAALLACTVGATFALTACGGDDSDVLNINSPQARIVNAVPTNTTGYNIFRNSDQQTDAGTPVYGQASNYFETVSTTSTWSIRDGASGNQVATASLDASGSTRYTFVAVPNGTVPTTVDLVSFSDPYDVGVGSDNVRARIFNASPNSGAFDVYITAPGAPLTGVTPTMSNVAYEASVPVSGADSTTFPSGSYEIRLTAAGTQTVFFDSPMAPSNGDDVLLVTLPNSATPGDVKILDVTTNKTTTTLTNQG